MVSTYITYASIARDLTKSLERVEAQPVVKRESEYYLAHIEDVKSIEEFMADDRLYRYAMKAFGLEEMTYARAFMVKVLEGGIDDSDSFANSLTDGRYKEFAETFNFARNGENTTIFSKARQGTVDRYMRQTLEEDAGAQNEGVRLALYFERKAGEVESAYGLLADDALSKVVRTVLRFPDSFALLDIDKQAEIIAERLDIEDLSDPEAVSELLEQFTALWEIDNPTSTTQTNIGILFGQPAEFGISTDVLLTIQQMKS